MKDAAFGTRNNATGDFKPNEPVRYPPVFVWPLEPKKAVQWFFGFPGYIWPWNLIYAGIGIGSWAYATPSLAEIRASSSAAAGWWNWCAMILARNAVLTVVYFGAFHLRLYTQRTQSTEFKYNGKWPEETNQAGFLFGNQNIDNVIWTMASGVPIWTAWECVTLWLYAYDYIPSIGSAANSPGRFIAMFFLVPLFRDVHFYLSHRLIHHPVLYRTVHKLHHKNKNPGPWSGLAMHPVEHLLYFSVVAVHWIVPSHPVHAVFNLMHAGLAPAPGHSGFHRVVTGESSSFQTHAHDHYLHHKHFECNYGDGVFPLDRWFGTFHDGTEASEERMRRRLRERRQVVAG